LQRPYFNHFMKNRPRRELSLVPRRIRPMRTLEPNPCKARHAGHLNRNVQR
jgi:hypothetical protein